MVTMRVNLTKSDPALNVREHPKFSKAKEELARRLAAMCHTSWNDEYKEFKRDKVYAIIFINGFHKAKMSINGSEKNQKAVDEVLVHMEAVRGSDNPEERYGDLGTKLANAAEFCLLNKNIVMEITGQFISRRVEEGASGEKLIAYREVRFRFPKEIDGVIREFLMPAEEKQAAPGPVQETPVAIGVMQEKPAGLHIRA